MPDFMSAIDQYASLAGELVQQGGLWVVLVIFILTFLKSLPLVAIGVPANPLLIGLGFALGAAGLDVAPFWIAISIGAALGDWVSYWLGTHFEHVVRNWRLVKKYPTVLPHGEAFFRRWGVLSILTCRFFGPLRASVPFISGVCKLRFQIFQLANWPSAFVWSAALLAPGILAARHVFNP